jgi:hypothetical protein
MSMRMTTKVSVILPTLLVALMACESKAKPNDATPGNVLAGEWNGKCSITKDQDDSKVTADVNAKLEFTQDGKYSQSITGHGKVMGNYIVTGQTINITSGGESVKMKYSIKNGVLATKTRVNLAGVPMTSTCYFRQGATK